MKKLTQWMTENSTALLMAAVAVALTITMFAVGYNMGSYNARVTNMIATEQSFSVENVYPTSVPGVTIRTVANPAMVEYGFPEAIAPDFFVGHGLGNGYEIFLDDSDRWDPLGIGVDDALALTTAIRQRVPGVTEDVYAKGHTLTVTFADSYLANRDEVCRQVEEVIQDFLDAKVNGDAA